MTKVSFFTIGCRVNQAETAVLEEVFRGKGFVIAKPGAPAEIAVINTCTVTDKADDEVRYLMRRLRRQSPDIRLALIGCQAELRRKELLACANVHWVIGAARKMDTADIIMEDLQENKRSVMGLVTAAPFTMPYDLAPEGRTRANLKIQDGCDHFCAYCEVPFARGVPRSREFRDIMLAARALAGAGYKEIILTGVNIGLYANEGKDLVDVIKGVTKIAGLERVRLSSIEYSSLVERLAPLMGPSRKFCRYLHVPVQSGCDRTLARMGRRYRATDLAATFKVMCRKVPGIMIGADVIAGFPGETDRDFEETLSFLEKMPVHYLHVFSYSDRSRARSRSFKRHVKPDVISSRAGRLRELGWQKRRAFLQGLVGSTVEVLFENKKDQHWIGHTDNYVTIKIISAKALHNRTVPVRITGVDGDHAVGTGIFR